jgi:hypothetical protein
MSEEADETLKEACEEITNKLQFLLDPHPKNVR